MESIKNMVATVEVVPEEIKALISGDLKIVIKIAEQSRVDLQQRNKELALYNRRQIRSLLNRC